MGGVSPTTSAILLGLCNPFHWGVIALSFSVILLGISSCRVVGEVSPATSARHLGLCNACNWGVGSLPMQSCGKGFSNHFCDTFGNLLLTKGLIVCEVSLWG